MKQIVTGIVAHVDAGKTTLSEALLYQTGAVRRLGRVDNGDAFLDSDALEKKRGITIFSHQAVLKTKDLELTVLDTPGHVDFATQTEQVLSVLDYAILVVSATDGVQGYTRTLWRLLTHYQVPTFIFINKMDAPGTDQATLLADLQAKLAPGCLPFPVGDSQTLPEALQEDIAMQDETVLNRFLETGTLEASTVRELIRQRQVFPCYFGSALKLQGVTELLAGMAYWSQPQQAQAEFGAKVFKITHDEKGERLTWVRLTGGQLRPKDVLVD